MVVIASPSTTEAATGVTAMARRKPLGTLWEGPDALWERDRADPQGVLAPQGHGTPAGPGQEDPQRDPLPLAERLPVGPAPRAVRPQEHRPRLVSAVGGRGVLEKIWAVFVAECDELG